MWNLFAYREQIMRAADLPAHRVSGGISVKMLHRSILTDSKHDGKIAVVLSVTRSRIVGTEDHIVNICVHSYYLPLSYTNQYMQEDELYDSY